MAALALPPAERDPYLRTATGGDDGLLAEVYSLLEVDVHPLFDASGHGGLALDPALLDLEGALDAAFSMDGARVGPYRLAEEIGRGGMGAVYRAERVDGTYEQTVALKLVKRGMDSETILRRFAQERQILARLQHPHIARLLDGGLADDGRPYFAMEYVEGESITVFCEARGLGVDDRLALFAQVCEAVAFAHRNLIVHRDLKPSNVLAAEDERGSARLTLLDFGIARLLDRDDEALTWSGLRPMTPQYAAPEQVRGGPVTTATDVYALGALLYELLTGRPPHPLDGGDLRALEAAILDAPPPHPSQVARTQELRGDLNTIVLKALAKEPEARYASVDALADDLRRHREGLPVVARRATVGYRVRKFVERHRAGVATAVGMVALLAAVVGVYTVRLAAERDRARLEAAKAAEVSAFLETLFTSADPAQSRGADITARELLAEGRARIESELTAQPAVRAQMHGTIGRVYHALGLHDEAEEALRQSLALLDETRGAPADLDRARTDLATLLTTQSAFDAADSLLQRALSSQRPEPSEVRARTLAAYGDLLLERGDYPAAESTYTEALAVQRTLADGDQAQVADLLIGLGVSYSRMGRYDEATDTHLDALAMHRRLYGDLHPATTMSMREASTSLRRLDRFDEAEALLREAIPLDSQLVGLEHPTMGENFYQYASLLNDTGRFDEATEMFERSLAVDRATLGDGHPYVAITHGDLGMVRRRAGDTEGAVRYFRQGIALARASLPPDHPQLGSLLQKLGESLASTDAAGAEAALEESLAIARARLDEDHVQVLSTRSALASFYSRVDRHAEAIAIHRDILERRRRTQGDESAITARSFYNLAAALRAEGSAPSLAEARALAAEAVRRYRAVFPAESREVGYVLMEEADVLRASDSLAAAHTAYRASAEVFRAALGDDHPATSNAERKAGEVTAEIAAARAD